MSAQLPLPRKIVVHGHWIYDGQKMSKSLGNTVDPTKIVEKYGLDRFRYFLLRTGRLDSDGDFNLEDFLKLGDNELSNQLGNLISRAFNPKFINRLKIGTMAVTPTHLRLVQRICQSASESFDNYQFYLGLEQLQGILQESNRIINERTPWSMDATDETISQLLTDVAFSLRSFALMAKPVIPQACDRLALQFGEPSCLEELFLANYVDLGGLKDLDQGVMSLFPRWLKK